MVLFRMKAPKDGTAKQHFWPDLITAALAFALSHTPECQMMIRLKTEGFFSSLFLDNFAVQPRCAAAAMDCNRKEERFGTK